MLGAYIFIIVISGFSSAWRIPKLFKGQLYVEILSSVTLCKVFNLSVPSSRNLIVEPHRIFMSIKFVNICRLLKIVPGT